MKIVYPFIVPSDFRRLEDQSEVLPWLRVDVRREKDSRCGESKVAGEVQA